MRRSHGIHVQLIILLSHYRTFNFLTCLPCKDLLSRYPSVFGALVVGISPRVMLIRSGNACRFVGGPKNVVACYVQMDSPVGLPVLEACDVRQCSAVEDEQGLSLYKSNNVQMSRMVSAGEVLHYYRTTVQQYYTLTYLKMTYHNHKKTKTTVFQ